MDGKASKTLEKKAKKRQDKEGEESKEQEEFIRQKSNWKERDVHIQELVKFYRQDEDRIGPAEVEKPDPSASNTDSIAFTRIIALCKY